MSLQGMQASRWAVLVKYAAAGCVLGTVHSPNGWAQGASQVQLNLGLKGTYSDNFYFEQGNEQAVAGVVLSPEIAYTRDSAATTIGLTSRGDFAAYSSNQEDNYSDGLGSAAINFKLPRNLVLGFTGIVEYGHDPFGTARTEGQPAQNQALDEWSQYTGSVALIGGQAETSRIGYELEYSSLVRDYQTNKTITQFLDRQFNSMSLTLLYHFSPKLSVLAQGSFLELEYDRVQAGNIDRSGNATLGLVGLRWEATAKTSGDIRFGRGQWKPESNAAEDVDSSYYEASINWRPTRRSALRVSGAREYTPTYRFDAIYIDTQTFSLEWTELWSHRWSTRLTFGYSERDFVSAAETHEIVSLTGRLSYQLERDLSLYVLSRYLDRDAQNISERFEANSAIVGFEARLN